LHSEYIHRHIERFGQAYNLRMLLMCDAMPQPMNVCLLNNITVIMAWSADREGQYLTQHIHSPNTTHRRRSASLLIKPQIRSCERRSRASRRPRVKKTDVETLRASFG
ncbi:hypothetical protein EDB85DRAFT_1849297, partial [Lactarius pseudohatsudake]